MMLCSIDGCEKGYFARGWCAMHYSRWQRHGNPFDSRAPRDGPAPRETEFCLSCHLPITRSGRRPSSARPGWCTVCATPYSQRDYIPPRYCNCYGDVPEPDVTGMCPDCLRLVERMAVA